MVIRVAFFGTPDFAVPTLAAVGASGHAIVGVVTQPDRPRGRGQRSSPSPVKAWATARGLPVFQPERLKDPAFLEAFAALDPELGVVAAYGRILPDALLAIPRLGMINVHASLLPKYRGAAPVHRAVMAGDDETGVTIMRVVKALDAGPMLGCARRPIGADETSEQVERSLGDLGARLLVRTIDRLLAGTVAEVPQDDAAATYAPRITRDDGVIDWSSAAIAIHNQIRGLHPWPHAYSYAGGARVIFWASTTIAAPTTEAPGIVLPGPADRLAVATGSGTLLATMLQAEGRRPLPAREFLAGHPLPPGSRFTSAP